MSWEPAHPVGFSPCGIAFGALRHCYSAPAKFFADDDGASNRINWYFVDDDTPVYEGVNVFWPRSDVPLDEATSVFEKEGLGRSVRLHNDGVDRYGFPGTSPHGDPDDYAGLSPRSKYFHDHIVPVSTCVNVKLGKNGLQLGMLAFDPTLVAFKFTAGLRLGITSFDLIPPHMMVRFGLLLRVVAGRENIPGLEWAAGVRFGINVQNGVVIPARLNFGLLTRVTCDGEVQPLHTYREGLRLGMHAIHQRAACAFGLNVGFRSTNGVPPEPLTVGIGLKNCFRERTLIVGGSSYETAVAIEMDTRYFTNIATDQLSYFVVTLSGETNVHGHFKQRPADTAGYALERANSPTDRGGGPADHAVELCLDMTSFPTGSWSELFVWFGVFTGHGHFEFKISSGPCP